MNNANQQPPTDLLDQATAALRQSQASPGPSRQLVEQTIASLLNPPEAIRLSLRGKIMFRLARHSKLVAAALLLGFGCGIFWLIDRGAAPAFAQVLENVNKATSVSFTTTLHFFPAPDRASVHQDLVMTWRFQGESARGEEFGKREDGTYGTVQAGIFDLATGQALEIDYQKKSARKRNLEKKVKREHLGTLVDSLSKMKSTDAELTGETIFNGRNARIYTLKKLPVPFSGGRTFEEGGDAILWVDAESGLPAQILIYQNSKDPKCQSQLTINNFTWNKAIDPKLFSLESPEGFKISTATRGNNVLSAFAQMLENVNKATSVSFTTTEYFRPSPELPETESSKWHLQGKLLREEKFVTTQQDAADNLPPTRTRIRIVDGEAKELLEINYQTKSIRKRQMPDAKAELLTSQVDAIRTLSRQDAELLDDEELNGRKTRVYRLKKLNPPLGTGKEVGDGNSVKLWVDAAGGLPVRLQINQFDANHTMVVLDEFIWNKPIDPVLFKPELPDDFKLSDGKTRSTKDRK